MSELTDELMGGIDENTSNDITKKKMKNFKNYMLKSVHNFNSYIKSDTKNNTEPGTKNNTKKKDTKNNTKPDTKNNSEPDSKNNTKNNTEPDTKNNTKNNTEPHTKNNTKKKATKNNIKSDTKNNTKPDTKNDIEWDINETRASIRKNQISIKNRYKSLLETKKTIKNNIDLIYTAPKKIA